MAAELVPVRLGVTAGDFYTLWAPRWRDGGDEWEAFLGKDDDLFAFESVADLAAFVRKDTTNDLLDHPAWERLTKANAHRLEPAEDRHADLIAVEELLADKPTEAGVTALASTLAVVSSIGAVCDLPTVMRFFNGNPNLGLVAGGIEQFTGRAGRKRWDTVGDIIARGWDGVLSAIDEVVTTPAVDAGAAKAAAAELDEPWEPEPEDDLVEDADGADADESDGQETEAPARRAPGDTVVLGSDSDFWEHVGIDPVRVITSAGTLYTLRCYFNDKPRFLGRNGRISVFGSERALARYLADEHDHDLSNLSTYDDIRTAATDGSLRIDITEDNIYVLNGLVDDIADGPDAIDRDQLALAVEFVRDVGVYSEDDEVDTLLADDTAIGRLVDYALEPSGERPAGPHSKAVSEWEKIESFVESRLRRE
ncbi:MAG: primosomal protein [Mycobacterium sp.]|nr:primosomal protein [Mycobacterium sp.]